MGMTEVDGGGGDGDRTAADEGCCGDDCGCGYSRGYDCCSGSWVGKGVVVGVEIAYRFFSKFTWS